MASVFERMIADFGRYETAHQLEQCMTFNQEKVARVPLRYRLIAMGFVGRFSLEEMNKKLTDMGCEQLYARNLVEASLIFAFRNSLSYSQWKKLEQECEETATKWEKKKGSFADGNITFGELKDYVMNHSLDRDDSLQTRQITRHLQEKLLNLQGGTEDFSQFLETKPGILQPRPGKDEILFLQIPLLLYREKDRSVSRSLQQRLRDRRGPCGAVRAEMYREAPQEDGVRGGAPPDDAGVRDLLRQSL